MPDYEIDDDLMEDIDLETQEATGADWFGGPEGWTENLSQEQMAYLSMNPDYMEQIMSDLGIDDAGDYTQFVNQYDPWKQDLAGKGWELGKDKLFGDTRKGLLSKLGDPLKTTNYAAQGGFEGMGAAGGGYLQKLEGLDIEGAQDAFSQGLQGITLARDEGIQSAFQDYTDRLYSDIGDIYSQQQAAKNSGGKK